MNVFKDKYVILELIPSHSNSEYGFIVQLQALKIDNLQIVDRFDYRIDESLIKNPDLLNLISYDKDKFIYTKDTKEILNKFKEYIGKDKLLIIDNYYTNDYLKEIKNKKYNVFDYLDIDVNGLDPFKELMDKYELEESNHFVDLLYEAIIKESNKHN